MRPPARPAPRDRRASPRSRRGCSAPGAALLAGVAVLRVGAGHLTLAESAAVALAVALPEAGVVGLPQNAEGSIRGDRVGAAADSFHDVDVLLVGPGLDDAVETAAMLRNILPLLDERTQVVLDAYTLGMLAQVPSVTTQLAGRLVLTPTRRRAGACCGARSPMRSGWPTTWPTSRPGTARR